MRDVRGSVETRQGAAQEGHRLPRFPCLGQRRALLEDVEDVATDPIVLRGHPRQPDADRQRRNTQPCHSDPAVHRCRGSVHAHLASS